MSSNPEFHIFRDSRRRTSTPELVCAVRKALRSLSPSVSVDEILSASLLAGELECALSDGAAPPQSCERAAHLADLLADSAIAQDTDHGVDAERLVREAGSILESISAVGSLSVSVPEGFAYYALHPLDYADLIAPAKIEFPRALVVGIRSIGTTLSAVTAAKLRQGSHDIGSRGVRDSGQNVSRNEDARVRRITVRPSGHPYDRQCEFNQSQRSMITSPLASGAMFLVCDEGPGRSGSSLLSVAEALEREGVPRARILILCAYEPDSGTLCAREAGQRWSRFRVLPAGMTRRLPPDAAEYLGSGAWRKKFFHTDESWPAVWPPMERLRYGSRDGGSWFTFEGHGPYGAAVRERQQALSESGYGLPYLGQEAGFGRHRLVRGRVAQLDDLSPQLLTHMAEYCAWRAREFAVADCDVLQLENMAQVNYQREFGTAKDDLVLRVERPTICDARMMPHEWLLSEDGRWLKLDAAIHGDDHFFPGPCDIAWDLAGVTVEWNLSPLAREHFLGEYCKAGGDDPTSRIATYETAYATFRMAWSAMAAGSVRDTEEEQRLLRDYQRYKGSVSRVAAAPLESSLELSSRGAL